MEMENVVAEAIFDFNPTNSIELTLKKGDIITVRRSAGDGWLEGEKDGKVGLCPSAYIKMVESSSPNDAPVSAKKPLIDNMLALEQKSNFIPEKAAELFVDGQRASIVAGPQWKMINEPMVIIVRDPQIETRFNGMKQFTVYVVETKALGAIVSRRYKHFLWLYDRLADMFPCLSLPPMPVKQFSGNLDPEFVYHRRRGLERFLNRCSCHPVFAYSKVFHDFLTRKDEKEWKIGTKSKAKKLFSPTIYSAVEYPQHNVPHSELVYVEKFSQFTRLLEANMLPVQQTCQKQSEGYGSIALSMTELGCNLQKLAKGTQLAKATQLESKNSASMPRRGSGQTTGMSTVQRQIRSAAELEENGEEPKYNWGWKNSADFTTLMSDLQEVGSEICKIAELFNFQQGILDQTLADLITDYNGIILTIPGLVKLHQDAMEIYENSKKGDSKKDAETMKINCETLHNIVLAEFDYLHQNIVADFRYIVSLYLRKQADFHLQLAERYELLHQSFMHMDTKFGCHPPMSTNGVDVTVEEPNGDADDSLAVNNTSALQKKTPYLNFFPMSCYQNVQFKQTKAGHIQAQIVTKSSVSDDKIVEDEVITASPQPTNSPQSADQSSINTVATASAVITTGSSTSSMISTSTSPLSNVSIPNSEVTANKTALALVEIISTTASSTQAAPSTTNTSTHQSVVTTSSISTSLSSDNADGPVSTSERHISTSEGHISSSDGCISASEVHISTSNGSNVFNSKVDSALIEVGDINPVYQSWRPLKSKSDSKPVPIVTANKAQNSEVPLATSAYDLMEPIRKPSTYNSSVFLSAPSSIIDNQISEGTQPSPPSGMLYENVVRVGDGKFTVTPPSSCDSKENLNFALESSPGEQQTSLNRSNSTGSLLPTHTVQHHATFHSPANNRKDILKYSASVSAVPIHHDHGKSTSLSVTDTNYQQINVRGSTAISRGTVKKKINLFENNTVPAGCRSLADLGILEDQDSDNGFVV